MCEPNYSIVLLLFLLSSCDNRLGHLENICFVQSVCFLFVIVIVSSQNMIFPFSFLTPLTQSCVWASKHFYFSLFLWIHRQKDENLSHVQYFTKFDLRLERNRALSPRIHQKVRKSFTSINRKCMRQSVFMTRADFERYFCCFFFASSIMYPIEQLVWAHTKHTNVFTFRIEMKSCLFDGLLIFVSFCVSVQRWFLFCLSIFKAMS